MLLSAETLAEKLSYPYKVSKVGEKNIRTKNTMLKCWLRVQTRELADKVVLFDHLGANC